MQQIVTQWSSDNRVIHKLVQEYVQQQIEHKWQSSRWRRVWFYIFEKEIRADLMEVAKSDFQSQEQVWNHPEYQALLARSAQSQKGGVERDDAIVIVNDYLFGQGDFATEYADYTLLNRLTQLLDEGQGPEGIDTDLIWMSDTVFHLKRTRDDIHLVQSIV